jgi:hypothetical protein
MHQTYVEPTKQHADVELDWDHDEGHTPHVRAVATSILYGLQGSHV